MKTVKISIVLLAALTIYFCVYSYNRDKAKESGQYHNGQILLPDYACTDTLIVTDASGLNLLMDSIKNCYHDEIETDGDYDSAFNTHCIVK